MSARGEFAQIDWIRRQLADSERVVVGVGDDCAVLRGPAADQLVTVDMLVENIHFDLAAATPIEVGVKGMNVNLSDIAAMAGIPTAAVVAVALPSGCAAEVADGLFVGLKQAADRFGVDIVGGDTNRSSGGLVLCVTLLGIPTPPGPVLRGGGQPGDVLCVTGPLGYSADGKHLHFVPRVVEAQRLQAEYRPHAMIDLSDGLGGDLFHLTNASGVGALLDAESIPVRTPANPIEDGRSPLEHALSDGEDFELLFALPPDRAEALLAAQPFAQQGVTIYRIGTLTADPRVMIRQGGVVRPLSPGGFVHQW